ncbi:DUF2993 domain-containing protein [Microtetraspora sp. NBRC 16547]|uniref:LmeA family phospholipid-binding protein n=1 Tax=Microtetraspora sp. NBRC 16547 TaxID=3030993 RepID=UPI0024A3ED7C|nr:DUF2993 domain-containing protein [Microtetraspora sp. NBRC 16547]GLW96445.1 hypothetical protein Misp02_05320 [Microtetraspora sp. NBRC 16547]
MRKLVVFLILLVVVLAVLDRVAVAGAQREIARQIEAKYDLSSTPTVHIEGIPFLTQAVAGRYEEISIATGSLTREGVTISKIDATLYGVSAPLADLIQDVSKADLRAERVTGTIVISRETLDALAPRGVKIEGGAGDKLRVSGKVTVLGQNIPVTADLKIETVQGGIRLVPTNVKIADGITVPNVEKFIGFNVPLKNLPLNLKIKKVRSVPEGLAVDGSATDVPLH